MYFISLREILIRSKSGSHDAVISANTPTFLPEALHEAATSAGCVPCDAEGNLMTYEDAKAGASVPAPAPVSEPEVEAPEPETEEPETEEPETEEPETEEPETEESAPADLVLEAVQAVLARNKAADFLASGRPRSSAVAKELGYKATPDEIEAAWQKVNEGLS